VPADTHTYIDFRYANDFFWNLTGHPRVELETLDWKELVVEDDFGIVHTSWDAMLKGKTAQTYHMRLKKLWIDQDDVGTNTWVEAVMYPELDTDGNITSESSQYQEDFFLTLQ
jgi:hypothetical protein